MADIVWTIPTYSAGRFTKSEVFELPFMARSAKGRARRCWSFVQKNALDEFQGVRPIFLHTNDGSSFHLSSAKGVRTLEDLKGLKIRAADAPEFAHAGRARRHAGADAAALRCPSRCPRA